MTFLKVDFMILYDYPMILNGGGNFMGMIGVYWGCLLGIEWDFRC